MTRWKLSRIAVGFLVTLFTVFPVAAQDRIGVSNLEGLQPAAEFPNPEKGQIYGAAWSPDSRFLALVGTENYGLRIYEPLQSDTEPVRAVGDAYSMYAVDWSPLSSLIASTHDGEATVLLWNAETGDEIGALDGGEGGRFFPLQQVLFSPDGKLLVANNTQDHTVYVWGVPGEGGLQPLTLDNAASIQRIATLIHPSPKRPEPYQIAFSPDSKTLGVTYIGAFPILWNMETYQMRSFVEVDDVGHITFRPDGKHIALSTPGGGLVLIDAGTLEKKDTLTHYYMRIGSDIEYSPDSTLLLAILENGNTANEIEFWDAHRGTDLYALPPYLLLNLEMDFSPDGRWLATIGSSERVTVWGIPADYVASAIPSPPPLTLGSVAIVSTLDGETLNVRGGPGTSYEKVFEMHPRTLVLLTDGPVEADGLRWWKVMTQGGQEGWAVEAVGGVQTLTPDTGN